MRKLRRCRRHASVFLEKLRSGFSHVRLHPFRFACFGGLGLALFGLVLTKSLPYALAPSFPDIALALNANNPAALMAKAEKLRDKLLKASGVVETIGARAGDPSEADTLAHLPAAKADSVEESKAERDDLCRQIRRLALLAIGGTLSVEFSNTS